MFERFSGILGERGWCRQGSAPAGAASSAGDAGGSITSAKVIVSRIGVERWSSLNALASRPLV
jgi:hypothetical protein